MFTDRAFRAKKVEMLFVVKVGKAGEGWSTGKASGRHAGCMELCPTAIKVNDWPGYGTY